jgi:hypothetical protein
LRDRSLHEGVAVRPQVWPRQRAVEWRCRERCAIRQTAAGWLRRVALVGAVLTGSAAAVGAILRPSFRRRIAATGAAAALAASSLFSAQPAAAATPYTVPIYFNTVYFGHIDDGYDPVFGVDDNAEVYGTFEAITSAGAASAGGWPFRNFGKWGKDPSGCPGDGVGWNDAAHPTCLKSTNPWTTYYPKYLPLCMSSTRDTCSTGYGTSTNSISVTLYAGQTLTVSALMYDYDWGSADDIICKTSATFGPYTEAQLAAGQEFIDINVKGSSGISMADNGNGACKVTFTYPNP